MEPRRTGVLAVWLAAASAVGAVLVLALGFPWALQQAQAAMTERREELGEELRRAAGEVSVRFTTWREDAESFLERPPRFVVTPLRHVPQSVPVPGAACRERLRQVEPGAAGIPQLQATLRDESFTADERAHLARELVRRLTSEGDPAAALAVLESVLDDASLAAETRLLLAFDQARRSEAHRESLLEELLPDSPGKVGGHEGVAPGRRAFLCRQLLDPKDPRWNGDALRALEFLDQAGQADPAAGAPVVSSEDARWVAWIHTPGPGRHEVVQGPAETFFAFFSTPIATGRFAVDPRQGGAVLAAPLPPWFLVIGADGQRELARVGALTRVLRLGMVGALGLLLGAVGLLSWRALRRERMLEHHRHLLEQHKGNFVTAVTHELKTPLATIALCAETLREHGATDPEAIPRFSRMILDETERLGQRIQQILDVAAGRNPVEQATEDFDAAGVIEAVVAELVPGANEHGVHVELRLGDRRPRLRGSSEHLAQALNGILENAVQFGGPGTVQVRATVDDGRYVVAIADQGPGLSADQRDKVFEPFVRLQPEMTRTVPGTGLGLTLVRQCVRALGGEVLARPRKPKGTVFLIRLPLPTGAHRS